MFRVVNPDRAAGDDEFAKIHSRRYDPSMGE